MSGRRTELRDALVEVLRAACVTDHRFETGKKHHRLYFTRDGVERFYVFSGTPSDRRGLMNAVAELRAMVGRPKQEKGSAPKLARRKAPPRTAKPPETITILPDPWDALRQRLCCPVPWWRRRPRPWQQKKAPTI